MGLYGPYRLLHLYGTYMDDKRLEIRISDTMLRHVDLARGGLARAAWVKLAIQLTLPAELKVPLSPGLEKAMLALNGPEAVRLRSLVASVPRSSGPPPRVVSAHTGGAGTLATPGCPECGTNMAHVDGRWVCGDCGFTR